MSAAKITEKFRQRLIQSLVDGTPLPPVEGLRIEVDRLDRYAALLKVSLVDGEGIALSCVFHETVQEGGYVQLSGFKKAFEIKVE